MYSPSWSSESKSEFEKCIQAHGGWAAWEKFDEFVFAFKKFSGVLLTAKGLNRRFYTPKNAIVNPKKRNLVFDYGTHKDFYNDGALIYSPSAISVNDGKTLFSARTF